MPNLPTLTVTQAQADRMIAAYGSVQAYQDWLKRQIVEYVLNSEEQARTAAFVAQQAQAKSQGRADLGLPDPTPPAP